MPKPKQPNGNKPRLDLTITKECATCGIQYHPRKNGYELISKYCSPECARRGRPKRRTTTFADIE